MANAPIRLDLLRNSIVALHEEITEVEERIANLQRLQKSLGLPKPRDPRNMRMLWILVGVAIGMVGTAAFLVIPGAFL